MRRRADPVADPHHRLDAVRDEHEQAEQAAASDQAERPDRPGRSVDHDGCHEGHAGQRGDVDDALHDDGPERLGRPEPLAVGHDHGPHRLAESGGQHGVAQVADEQGGSRRPTPRRRGVGRTIDQRHARSVTTATTATTATSGRGSAPTKTRPASRTSTAWRTIHRAAVLIATPPATSSPRRRVTSFSSVVAT